MNKRSSDTKDRRDRTEVTLGSFRIYRPGQGDVTEQVRFEAAVGQVAEVQPLPADVARATLRN